MNNKAVIIMLFLFYVSADQLLAQQNWETIHLKTSLKDTLFVSDQFIYSDYVFKDENGKWESAMWGQNGEQIIDTSIFMIGANCVVDNGDPHTIRFCDCSLNNDTLLISVYDSNAAYFDNILIKGAGEHFTTSYNAAYPAFYPGESYVWKVKKQKMIVTTNRFEKGKWLNGFINLEIVEFFKSNTYPLTLTQIKIKGYFKCVIK